MIEGLVIRLLIAFFALIVAFPAIWVMLRIFDKTLTINFKESFNKMQGTPQAMAVYYGLRFLGVCGMVGYVVGKAIGF